jgi:Cu/Ag efflux pump CusA
MITVMRGTKVGEIYDDQKIFDVVVWSQPWVRGDLFALRRLLPAIYLRYGRSQSHS